MASGSEKRSALACTWSSFFIPSSLIPGREQQGGNCLSSPRTAGGRKLWDTKLSQKRDSRRSCSLLLSLAPATFGCLHPHATCYVQLKDWHWLPVRAQTELSASGGDPKSGRKICLKGKAETLDCTLWAMALGDTSRGSCPTGKACVSGSSCAQGWGSSAHMAEQGCTICHTPCQPLH